MAGRVQQTACTMNSRALLAYMEQTFPVAPALAQVEANMVFLALYRKHSQVGTVLGSFRYPALVEQEPFTLTLFLAVIIRHFGPRAQLGGTADDW